MGTVVKLRSSRGLTMRRQAKEEEEEEKDSPLERDVEIQLPEVEPFSSVSAPLIVLAELGPQRDAATIEHMVSISSTLVEQRQDVDVHFIPPFMSSHKLHTANTSKFLQVRTNHCYCIERERVGEEVGMGGERRGSL
ncbi:hypothetical protein GWK47_006296 [Chionoecetes opilio]|uniref:TRAPPC10 Ig-like domain-containing protein n=1 Tax=Chionoecetes opilio TaxID=41210 RepID=A0A8J4Y6G0_CHIOP|nr:hypothetical protein GWK47_006296 [Chionoecetes opilio]